jgi:hypothetical protein
MFQEMVSNNLSLRTGHSTASGSLRMCIYHLMYIRPSGPSRASGQTSVLDAWLDERWGSEPVFVSNRPEIGELCTWRGSVSVRVRLTLPLPFFFFYLAATPLLSIHGTWLDLSFEMLNGTGIRIFTGASLPWYMKLAYGLSTMARHESPPVGRDYLQTVSKHT